MESPRREIEIKIQTRLISHSLVADLLLNLFACSLRSYKRASVCTPVPLQPTSLSLNGSRRRPSREDVDYEQLEKHFSNFTNISTMCNQEFLSLLPLNSLLLLEWILFPQTFDIKQVGIQDYERSHKLYYSSSESKPRFIFEIQYRNSPDFDEKKILNGIDYGFHGSALENFHSIVHNGLTTKFGKEGLYGRGIYLALDNRVSEGYYTFGSGWEHSLCSRHIALMAGCEIITNPKCVRWEGATLHGNSNRKSYAVVEQDEMVRVKHILVYEGQPKQSFGADNKFLMILVIYAFLLFLLGFLRSSTYSRFSTWMFVS